MKVMCAGHIHAAAQLTLACVLSLAGTAPVGAVDPAPAKSEAPSAGLSPVAGRLWKDLVCLCGRCPRETLAECHCPDAAKERHRIEEMLNARDLSTPAAQQAAYEAVVQNYIARFGGRRVLASESDGWRPGAWGVLVAVLLTAAVAINFIEGRRKRARSRAARGSPRRR